MNFVKRPVALFTLSLFVFFSVTVNAPLDISPLFAIIFAVLFILFLVFSLLTRKKVRTFFAYLAIIALAMTVSTVFSISFMKSDSYFALCEEERQCELCVLENSTSERYIVRITKVDGKQASFKSAVLLEDELEAGDIVSGKIIFSKTEKSFSFDEEKYYLSRGIRIKGEMTKAEIIGSDTSSFSIKIGKLREKLASVFDSALSRESSSVTKAIVLGEKNGMSESTKRDFSRLGISHLLAISGMHISFISSALSFMMKGVRAPKKLMCAITTAVVALYMVLAGFSPSVVRAALLCIMMCILYIIGLSYDGLTCLGICVCIMLAVDPYCAYSVALQLSFSSYLGCLAAAKAVGTLGLLPSKNDRLAKKSGKKLLSSLLFTVIVVIFTLPVTWLYFDTASVVSPLSNLFFIPALSIVLYLSFFLLAVCRIPPMFAVASFVEDKLISALLFVAHRAAGLKGITVSIRYSFAPFILFALVFFVCVLSLVKKKKQAIAPLACIAFLLASYAICTVVYESLRYDTIEVTRVGSYYGEELVVLSGSKSCVIDISGTYVSDLAGVERALGDMCQAEVDKYIVTGYSSRTAERIGYFAEKYPGVEVCIPYPDAGEEKLCAQTKEFLDNNLIKCTFYSKNTDQIELSGALVCICSFERKDGAKNVTCVQIERDDKCFMYLGKGYASSNAALLKLHSSKARCVFFGSSGGAIKSQYDISDIGADIYFFAKTDEESVRFVSQIDRSDRYETVGVTTVRIK